MVFVEPSKSAQVSTAIAVAIGFAAVLTQFSDEAFRWLEASHFPAWMIVVIAMLLPLMAVHFYRLMFPLSRAK